jgi:hypothetical protein
MVRAEPRPPTTRARQKILLVHGREHLGRPALECPVSHARHPQRALFLLPRLRDIAPPYERCVIPCAVHGLQHGLNPCLKVLLCLCYPLAIHPRGQIAGNLTEILPAPCPGEVMGQRGQLKLWLPRAFAAMRSSPVAMTGCSSLCLEDRILPLRGAHVSLERVTRCWPLPHVAGSPGRGVLSASLTAARSSGRPRLIACQTLQAPLAPDGSPLFVCNPLAACPRYEPRKLPRTLAITPSGILPSPLRDWVGRFDPFDFGASYPFTGVLAYSLPVSAAQCPSPGTTQDSVPGCWSRLPAWSTASSTKMPSGSRGAMSRPRS